MILMGVMLGSLVRLVRGMVDEPIGCVTTMLYGGNVLPRNLNLERFVRPEFLHPQNYFFHLVISILKCFW